MWPSTLDGARLQPLRQREPLGHDDEERKNDDEPNGSETRRREEWQQLREFRAVVVRGWVDVAVVSGRLQLERRPRPELAGFVARRRGGDGGRVPAACIGRMF
jgi:hypothetical protein